MNKKEMVNKSENKSIEKIAIFQTKSDRKTQFIEENLIFRPKVREDCLC